MDDAQWTVDRKMESSQRASRSSSDHPVRCVVQKNVEALLVLMKSGADAEKLGIEIYSLEKLRILAHEADTSRDSPVYFFTEVLEAGLNYVIYKENNRAQVQTEDNNEANQELAVAKISPLKGFKCDICSKYYTTKECLRVHKKIHQDCGKAYAQRNYLLHHSRSHSDDYAERNRFACDECGKRFRRAENLSIHKRSHLQDEKQRKPFECEECGQRFTQRAHISKHMKIHMQGIEMKKNFTCDECGKKFSQSGQLSSHKKTHLHCDNGYLEDEELRKPFKCEECGKRYTQSSHLSTHKISHYGIDDPRRTIECDICLKKIRVTEMTRHKLIHLDDNDAEQVKIKRRFKCEECGRAFMKKTDLFRHLRTHSKDDSVKRPYGCSICGLRIATSAHLNQHMKSHSNDDAVRRPHVCSECGKRCSRAFELATHMRIHSSDDNVRRPYVCNTCGTRFATSPAMKRHIQRCSR